MNSLITAKNISVVFGDQRILEDVSFEIQEKDIAIVLGPNGSGKSTLLKAMLGIVRHTGDFRMSEKNMRESLRHIGYVPQRFDFDRTFPITNYEFLNLFSESEQKIEKALSEVDMLHYKNRTLGELSGGQLQRILIARAILTVPRLLVLDEPTSGIDAEGKKSFFEIIKHLNEEHGVTILMVSHEINVVYDIATRVICLNKNLVCSGAPKEVLTQDTLNQLYGSNMQHHVH